MCPSEQTGYVLYKQGLPSCCHRQWGFSKPLAEGGSPTLPIPSTVVVLLGSWQRNAPRRDASPLASHSRLPEGQLRNCLQSHVQTPPILMGSWQVPQRESGFVTSPGRYCQRPDDIIFCKGWECLLPAWIHPSKPRGGPKSVASHPSPDEQMRTRKA